MALYQNTKISRHILIPFTAHSLGNPGLWYNNDKDDDDDDSDDFKEHLAGNQFITSFQN